VPLDILNYAITADDVDDVAVPQGYWCCTSQLLILYLTAISTAQLVVLYFTADVISAVLYFTADVITVVLYSWSLEER